MAATGTGFYYAKAKAENRIKLMKSNKVTPTENTFDGAQLDAPKIRRKLP